MILKGVRGIEGFEFELENTAVSLKVWSKHGEIKRDIFDEAKVVAGVIMKDPSFVRIPLIIAERLVETWAPGHHLLVGTTWHWDENAEVFLKVNELGRIYKGSEMKLIDGGHILVITPEGSEVFMNPYPKQVSGVSVEKIENIKNSTIILSGGNVNTGDLTL